MEAHWGNRGLAPLILNIGDRWRWSASRYGRLHPGQNPVTHYIGGLIRPRAGLNIPKKRKLCCPYRYSKPRLSSPQPTYYTDRAITAPTQLQCNYYRTKLVLCQMTSGVPDSSSACLLSEQKPAVKGDEQKNLELNTYFQSTILTVTTFQETPHYRQCYICHKCQFLKIVEVQRGGSASKKILKPHGQLSRR